MKFADTITVALAVLVAIVVLGPALARATEESADFMTQAALGMDAHPDAGSAIYADLFTLPRTRRRGGRRTDGSRGCRATLCLFGEADG